MKKQFNTHWLTGSIFLILIVFSAAVFAAAPMQVAAQEKGKDHLDSWVRYQMKGDYPEMVKRRVIRVLVPPSKTFFFIDKGQKRGVTYDALMTFEKYINRTQKNKNLQIKVVVIPTSRKHLLPDLLAGRGEIAAGNLTVTPERRKLVDFSEPILTGINEIVVTGGKDPALRSLFDLAGREVFVRRSSSYYSSLQHLNKTLQEAGKQPLKIQLVDEYLEDEDLLEMVNAGLLPMIVVDDIKGRFWGKIFPHIVLHPDLQVRAGGKIAWAIRKDTPKLKEVVNGFIRKNKKGTLTGNILYDRYWKNTKYVRNNLNSREREKYKQTVALFKKYGEQYDFPYLLLTALAYQESGLDQKKRSRAGAIGIMQVLPKTAADKNVGIRNIDNIDNNIHAGSKYLRFMKNRYFSDGSLDELNSDLFTIAAYNAGPVRIAQLREEAKRRGLNPNVWFNNVEVIAARRIGRETVRYVSNIYKYYVAYKRIAQQEEMKKNIKERLQKKHGHS